MTFFDKLRAGGERTAAAPARSGALSPSTADSNRRPSNGLKDFLWLLSDVQQGQLLDLGPVSQATVSFFTGRGFKIYSDDLLRAWRGFLDAEENRLRASSTKPAKEAEFSLSVLAQKFLQSSVAYPPESFHAILVWDLLDYLEEELLADLVSRFYAMLRPGGVVLGLFHSKKPEAFHRYRIPDADTIELYQASAPCAPLRLLQNRDLMKLFAAFRSSKTFVGRDQLREGLFLK